MSCGAEGSKTKTVTNMSPTRNSKRGDGCCWERLSLPGKFSIKIW